ncbi:MAG: RNA-guided pseudouridylation complex pseudouridine synthase subunit Cbf5 [Candidatus ainarchaeum sp.]|nr:RNA-guided pseudouridylation complex pseudouridine synthase subunit Cbf5 [Candidatus ainarchaeum sp.]
MPAIDELLKNSVIIINKPPGHSSHEITTFVKKITGSARAGHAGTLDPDVSGVLPVALGRATKLLQYIAGKDKTYVGIMKFRQPPESIGRLFAKFTGTLVQTPPKMSAVRKAPRRRTVHSLKLLQAKGNIALFEAKVDAGTYIRTLCEDMGKECGGARMEELRRTAVGKISEKDSWRMEDVIDAMWLWKNRGDESMLRKMLRPPESLIGLPRAFIKESALNSIYSGAQVMTPAVEGMEAVERGERVAMYCGGLFIGVGVAQVSDRDLAAGKKKGLAIRLERIHRPEK